MTTISVHLANTSTGDYDVRLPLPKPLHCEATTGRINRPTGELEVDQVIGFTAEPDDFDVDLTWVEWAGGDPLDVDEVLGLFPVVSAAGEFATLTVPVTSVSVDGRRVGESLRS